MHSPTPAEHIKAEFSALGKKPPKLLMALYGEYIPEISPKDVFTLLVDLCKSYEYYAAVNKPKDEWDEYDYLILPIWIRLKEMMEK